MSEQKKATPAQIALAWLLAQKPWIVPIPGTTKLSRLDENIGATAVEVTQDDLREIENTASKITIQGERYPDPGEKDRYLSGQYVEEGSRLRAIRKTRAVRPSPYPGSQPDESLQNDLAF